MRTICNLRYNISTFSFSQLRYEQYELNHVKGVSHDNGWAYFLSYTAVSCIVFSCSQERRTSTCRKNHLALLLSGLRVEHISYSISSNVRSLVPYISHITIMCWTLNVCKGERGLMHSLYLHLPYIGCTHVPGTHPPRSLSYCEIGEHTSELQSL